MRASGKMAGESGALLAGSVVNGVAAYGFIALGTRGLGAEAFAPVAIAWVFWAFSSALLTFPIQHWVIRQMEVDGHPGGVRAALGRLAALAGAVAAAEGLAAAVWREQLFGERAWAWPLVVMGVAAGAGFLGMVRGVLAGSGRYHAAAAAIGGENIVRLAAGALSLALGGGPVLLAASLLMGPAIAVFWPGVLRLDRGVEGGRPGIGLVGAAGLSVLLAQVVLNGGPPVLSAIGGTAVEVTALFAALALFRAPYLVALGLSVRATAPLARRVADRGTPQLRSLALGVGGGSVVLAAAALAVAWSAGPPVIRALFGPDASPSGPVAGGVAAGCVLALGSLALTVMLIAASARFGLAASWLAATVVGAIAVAAVGGPTPVHRVVIGFNAAELTAVGVAAVVLSSARRAGRSGVSRRRVVGRET